MVHFMNSIKKLDLKYFTVGIRNPDVSRFQMADHVRISNGDRILNGKGKKKTFFYIWKPDTKNVQILNGSSFRMVGFRIPNEVL